MTKRYRIGWTVIVTSVLLLTGCGRIKTAEPNPAADLGEAAWKKTCAPCHDGGLGDGPAIGDKEAWQPRMAQGKAVLLRRALNGFAGKLGEMPPRGGDESLSDDQVEAALTYMIAKSE